MSKNIIRNEFREIEKGSSKQVILNLFKYIEQVLPDFQNSQEFKDITIKKKNENQYSTALNVFLNQKLKSTEYSFVKEEAQRGTYSCDIGVYHGCILIFAIEAKLLPTPKQTGRSEHEYVYGKGAGIQRFRDGFHGVDNQDRPLSDNGMIAYIKENKFEYWIAEINRWIIDAQWNKSEILEKIYFRSIAKLISKHPRVEASDLTLHHFWLYVN